MIDPDFPEDGIQDEIDQALDDHVAASIRSPGPPIPDEFLDTRTGLDKRSARYAELLRENPDHEYFDPISGLDMRSAEFKAAYPEQKTWWERIRERIL